MLSTWFQSYLATIACYWYYLRTHRDVVEIVKVADMKGSRKTGWILLSLIVLLFMVSVNILNVIISDVSRTFTTDLNQKNEAVYWKYLYLYASIFVFGTPIVVYNIWIKRILFVHWRRWLTHYLLDKYFGNDRAFYRINGRSTSITRTNVFTRTCKTSLMVRCRSCSRCWLALSHW